MPFQKGQSGNPAGRPPGSKNRSTIFAEALLDGEAEMIMRNAIRAAVNDVPWAVRLCFDRLSPRLGSRAAPIAFELPQITTLADIPPAIAKISSALAAGELTIDEAERYTRVLERWMKMLQSAEPNGRPARKIEFRWISQDDAAATGSGDDMYIVVDDDEAKARGLPPIQDRAIDNPIVVSNGDAAPGGPPPIPSPTIDNPIVVGNHDAEPGGLLPIPSRAIDDSTVVSNGDAEPGGRPPIPNPAIDNPNGGAEPGGQPPIPSQAIDNPIVVGNDDAQPGGAAVDPEPEPGH
jgi:Family of unknown function (DUF5681)